MKKNNNLLLEIINGIEEVKGENLVILDLSKLENSISDYFVICEGNSNTQVTAIANSIRKNVSKILKEKPFKEEGADTANWILLDYTNIIVHVFQKPTRLFYRLDDFWKDALKVDINNLKN
ncbi:MAG: ribosome silencing factor [Solirubrobacteraceae bacterium]